MSYLNPNYMWAFHTLQGEALWCPPSHMKAQDDSGKIQRKMKSWSASLLPNKVELEKERDITFGEHIFLSFNINKSFRLNGFRFDLVPTLGKPLHP